MHQLRGAIFAFDFVLSGGLDQIARKLLGLSEDPPKPPEDYMRQEEPTDG